MSKTETRNDKLRAAHEQLQQAVAEIASGDDWKRMHQKSPSVDFAALAVPRAARRDNRAL